MLLKPRLNITIGQYSFTRAHSVEWSRNIRSISSEAKIKVPVSATIVDKEGGKTTTETPKVIKPGDNVTIQAWYEGYQAHTMTYAGKVKRINQTIPCEIECDDMYTLQNGRCNRSWEKTTVQEVIGEILSDTGYTPQLLNGEVTLEPYIIPECSKAYALQQLCDETGLVAYALPGNKLYVGLAYTPMNGNVTFSLSGDNVNVINADELKYRLADDVKLNIKAININGDNSRIEAQIGDPEGASRTLHFYNLPDKAALEAKAKEEIQKYKYNGYEGKIKCFGIPRVEPGMTAVIKDPRFAREGNYFIEGVETSITTEGICNTVLISIKV